MLDAGAELRRLIDCYDWSVRRLADEARLDASTVQAALDNDTDLQLSTGIKLFLPFERLACLALVTPSGAVITLGYNPTKPRSSPQF